LLAGKEITRMDVDGSGLANRESQHHDPWYRLGSRMQRGVWRKEFPADSIGHIVCVEF